jgi:hypothetical protein
LSVTALKPAPSARASAENFAFNPEPETDCREETLSKTDTIDNEITWMLEAPLPDRFAWYLVIMLSLHFPSVHVMTDRIGRIIGLKGPKAAIERVLGRRIF